MIHKISLRKKIIFAAISCVFISLSLSAVFFLYTQYKTLKTGAYAKLNLSIKQVSSSINSKLTNIENDSFAFLSIDNMKEWANRELNFKKSSPSYIKNITELRNDINSRLMFNNAWISKYINTIYLFADNETIQLVTRYPSTLTKTDAKFNQIYNDTKQNDSTNFYYIDTTQQPKQVYMIRRMNDITFKEQLTLIFHINESAFSEELIKLGNNINSYIVYNNQVIFSNNYKNIGQNSNNTLEKYKPKDYFILSRKLGHPNFDIHILTSYSDIMRPIRKSLSTYIIVVIILIFLFAIAAGMYAGVYTRFIRDLNDGIKKVRNSNFNATMPVYKNYELNNISCTFNSMTNEIQRLINSVYKSNILLKEADIKMLQSQINPHFLINTLTTIGTKALLSGDKEIYNMTNALSNMLDAGLYSTNQHSSFITIEKELEYIKCYLYLQQIRFQDKLSYQIKVSQEQLLSYYIPRLSIEPFVENSVIHGIEDNTKYGFITVSIEEIEGNIIAKITDNGKGMDITKVLKTEKPQNKKGHHIGISNTNKRLKLLFGDKYGVTFESEPNIKTCVYVKIPMLKEPPKSEENKVML